MNKEAKLAHIDRLNKAMQRTCFDLCFSSSKVRLDDTCVRTCYDKFLYSLKFTHDTIKDEGRKCKSDFVYYTFGEYDKRKLNRVYDDAFPIGG